MNNEQFPFKRGKEDQPEPGLTAAKAMFEALEKVRKEQEAKKLEGRKHKGPGEFKGRISYTSEGEQISEEE